MSAGPARRRRQQGFLLVMALFLVVSLAAIGVYLVTISNAQVEAGVQDQQGARAYQAARTGVDWGAYQLLQNAGGGFSSTCINGGGGQTLTLTGGLAGFFAEVGCTVTGPETEGGVSLRPFQLKVTGCNTSPCGSALGPTYVERQLQLTLVK